MDPEALTFIDDPDTQRVVITWPLVALSQEPPVTTAKQFPEHRVWFSLKEWSGKSGVDGASILRLLPILAAHSIIAPDGTVPHDAITYIRRCIAKRLK